MRRPRRLRGRRPRPATRGSALLAGAVAGGLLASVHAYFVLSRGANQLATGLVVLFLGLGLTSLFGVAYVQAAITRRSRRATCPVLVEHPVHRRRSSSTTTR